MKAVEKISAHLLALAKFDSRIVPWPRMILCALATGVPLFIGVLQDKPLLAIYGALTGYLLGLNDHLGTLPHRLFVISLTFVGLIAGFAGGLKAQEYGIIFEIPLAVLVYWLGLFGGRGAECERGLLFATLAFSLAYFAGNIPSTSHPALLTFGTLGFFTLFTGIPLLYFIRKNNEEIFASVRTSFSQSMTMQIDDHIHAASYTLTALLSVWLAHYFSLERGYWVLLTVLLIMKPDRTQAIYKTSQRLIGTVAAVFLASFLLLVVHHVVPFTLLAIICAFAVPWAAKRNYLLVSFFATMMVISLLEIAVRHHSDTHLPFVRLQATLIGCALSMLGTGISKSLDFSVSTLNQVRRD